MSNLRALIRLEFKSRFSSHGVPVKTRLLRYGLAIVFGGLIYALYCYLNYSLVGMFHVYEYDYSLLQLFALISQLALVGFGTGSVIKNLFMSGDNELMLRFPVDSRSILIAKATILIIVQAIGNFIMTAPFYIIFGVETNAQVGYYFSALLVYVLSLAFSLALSMFLALPVMMISGKFKHLHLLNLIFNIVIVAGFFALYMLIVNSVVKFARDQSLSLFSVEGMKHLDNLKFVYPVSFFADILAGSRAWHPVWLAYIGAVISTGLLAFGAYSMCQKLYLKIILRNIESEGASFKLKTKNVVCNPLTAVLKREWHDIFRSSNYSFQYLVMACAAPIMVYSCNDLATSIAVESLSTITQPMVALLVMLIFVTITVSFAGSCISREGGSFYLTKVSPVSVRGQVLIKVGLYLFVAFISILVSLSVVIAAKRLQVADGFIIMADCILFAIALTAFAVKLDVLKPQFPIGGEGELVNGNFATFIAMLTGFALAVGEGIFGLVGFVLWSPAFTYGMLALINGVFAIAAVVWLLVKLPYYYNRISER